MLHFFPVLVFSLIHNGVEIDLRLWDQSSAGKPKKNSYFGRRREKEGGIG
jgi:hypothetical protein